MDFFFKHNLPHVYYGKISKGSLSTRRDLNCQARRGLIMIAKLGRPLNDLFFSPSNTNPFWWPLLSHARKNFFRNQLLIVVLMIWKDVKKRKKSKWNQWFHIRIHSFTTVSRNFSLSYICKRQLGSFICTSCLLMTFVQPSKLKAFPVLLILD